MRRIGNWILAPAVAVIAASAVVVPLALPETVMAQGPTMIYNVWDLQDMNLDLAGDYALANSINATETEGWNTCFPLGAWVSNTTYYVRDYVTHVGNYYLCHTEHASGATFWGTNWTNWGGTEPPVHLGFEPVGLSWEYFTGSLDGNGYTIIGLYINRPLHNAALFDWTSSIQISDVTLADVDITGKWAAGLAYQIFSGVANNVAGVHVSGTVRGSGAAAGLILNAEDATITNCSFTGTVTLTDANFTASGFMDWAVRCVIEGSYTSGTIVSGCYAAGFIADVEDTTIRQSSSDMDITAADNAGGFISYSYESAGTTLIENCYARGSVNVTGTDKWAAGFVTWNYATVHNSYSTGLVVGTNPTRLGGFCADNGGTITDCFWDTETSGQATSAGGTGRETIYMTDICIYDAAGWDIAPVWIPPAYRNDGYPVHGWVFGSGYDWLIHSGGMTSDIWQVVWFQPNAIIVGTTLPNRAEEEDGIITWGANPAGITITYSMLQPEKEYQFEPFLPPALDIIDPEPGGMTSDVALDRLTRNPLRPLAQILSSTGGMTERLAWLGIAIFVLIALMIYVQLKTTHIVFTSLVGLGVATSFYLIGVFPLWVVVVLAFGLVGSIIYERMPVL